MSFSQCVTLAAPQLTLIWKVTLTSRKVSLPADSDLEGGTAFQKVSPPAGSDLPGFILFQ